MAGAPNSGLKNVVNIKDEPEIRRRRVFRPDRSKLPLVIVALLLVYISFSLVTRFDQLHAMQNDLDAIQKEIAEIRDKNQGLQKQIERLQSDAYVEQVAREKLGLVKPGEARIVPVQPEGSDASTNVPDVRD
ncbi:cell division protein DivIC [Desulfotomaculum arcticum]|uniref:Cell division protein DivIC n=1 Tax=Desulfotruncus arcticus DSM 17038 TaxID=1121424 RepID=A0A1I2WF88_9FIRM|nr:septum formation initiator family protein [Desulfotruncus arcticus]SFG99990.1 cell division protein DivIC [Desulfotomaculum arcticum] [Desulfotruncus arcticus DSM 17038]